MTSGRSPASDETNRWRRQASSASPLQVCSIQLLPVSRRISGMESDHPAAIPP
jgi:hypothetical protein